MTNIQILTVFLASLLIGSNACKAAAPTWEWVRSIPNNYSAPGVTVDPEGNVYWAGNALSGNLGPTAISQEGLFISKLLSSGVFQWSKVFPGNSFYSAALAVDSRSNLILAGFCNSPSTLLGSTVSGGFTAKFSNSGDLTWLRNFTSIFTGGVQSTAVAVAPDDRLTTISTFNGQAALDSFSISSVNQDVLLLGLSSSGSARWLKRGGGEDYDYATSIAVDALGNSYVAGQYTLKATFGSFTTPSVKANGGFVAKYDANGVALWLQSAAGVGVDTFSSIGAVVVTPDGNVAVIGKFIGGAMDIGGKRLLNSDINSSSVFIAKIDSSTGSVLSTQIIIPSVQLDFGPGALFASCDIQGTLRIAGSFNSDFTFGTTRVTNEGGSDIFVAAVNITGKLLWIKSAGLSFSDQPTGLAYDGSGHTYICGTFLNASLFDNLLVEGNRSQAFLAKLTEDVAEPPIITSEPISQITYGGSNVVITASAVSGTPVRYQWFFNNSLIPGKTNSSLLLNTVTGSEAGFYFVEVSNEYGSIRSTAVELIVRHSAPQLLTTIAGTNVAGYRDATGTAARFDQPNSPAVTFDGNIITPENDNTIRMIQPDGVVGTFAGNTNGGFLDAAASAALFSHPLAVTIDRIGDVFVADTGNNLIRRISGSGVHPVTTYAGSGVAGYKDGPVHEAQFDFPNDLAFDSVGNLYVTEFFNHTVRKITPTGLVSTLAGNGTPGYKNALGTNALLNMPAGIAVDLSDNLYVTEWSGQRIRKITPAGAVTTVAGIGQAGYLDGPALAARLNTPDGITVDSSGNVYFTEYANHTVRKLDQNGIVTTVAGLGTPGFQDGDANAALLHSPGGIAWCPDGSLVIADTSNNAIRKLSLGVSPIPTAPTLLVRLYPGITIFGPVGKSYSVEAADSSMGPLDWITIGTITLAQPVELFFDSAPATRSQRFYRATEVR